MKKNSEIIQKLAETALFKNISERDIEQILSTLSPDLRSYPKESIIINEGDSISNLSIVISGSVLIQTIDYWGNINIKANISEYEIFAETFACLNSVKANCQVCAQTDCTIMHLNIDSIFQSTTLNQASNTQLLHNLLNILAWKNYMLTQKIDVMNKKTTREKLMEFLAQQSKQQNSSTIKIPFNRQQLSDYLSVDRSGLSTEISKLVHEGVLHVNKNLFTLL